MRQAMMWRKRMMRHERRMRRAHVAASARLQRTMWRMDDAAASGEFLDERRAERGLPLGERARLKARLGSLRSFATSALGPYSLHLLLFYLCCDCFAVWSAFFPRNSSNLILFIKYLIKNDTNQMYIFI
jgi:hypothetical protein